MRISWICHVALNLFFFLYVDLKLRAVYGSTGCVMACVASVLMGSTKASRLSLGLGASPRWESVAEMGTWVCRPMQPAGMYTALGFLYILEHNTKMQGSVQLAWLSRYSAVTSTKEKVEDVVNRLWKHIRVNSRSCVRWRIAAHSLQWRTHDFYCLF